MRIFLVIVSFASSLLYFLIYSYFDTIIGLIGPSYLSAGLQSFIKILVLLIAGFCTGLIPMLLLAPGMKRTRLDVRNLILVGIVPFILLIFSPGPVNDFIATKIFSNNETKMWTTIMISAILFTLAHIPNRFISGHYSIVDSFLGLLTAFSFGIFIAFCFYCTNNLFVCIGLH